MERSHLAILGVHRVILSATMAAAASACSRTDRLWGRRRRSSLERAFQRLRSAPERVDVARGLQRPAELLSAVVDLELERARKLVARLAKQLLRRVRDAVGSVAQLDLLAAP